MKYISTRGTAEELEFKQVLLTGLARDGGLYIPKVWPSLQPKMLSSFVALSYEDLAFEVMRPFIGKAFSHSDFKFMIKTAYSNFDHDQICPLVDLTERQSLLELFHGPTMAFKDFAMQLIGQMFDYFLMKSKTRVTIVAATSGDTGSAAMSAFSASKFVNVFILFPDGRVSEVQRRQMTTISRPNIHAISVDGDFDDCQSLVKEMFNDFEFRDKVNLSGVNSINWARVMCQIPYFFFAYSRLRYTTRKVSFSVPTGNFGDVFAGYVARKMGLPIDKLIIATNENDILHRALQTGIYKKKKLVATISPSMDIQVASNFERLLFDYTRNNPEKIVELMSKLKNNGEFYIESDVLSEFRDYFTSYSASEKEVKIIMRNTLESFKTLVCPHTAVGIAAARKVDNYESHIVTLATANAAKFPEATKMATGILPKLPTKYHDLFSRTEDIVYASNNLSMIKDIIFERIS